MGNVFRAGADAMHLPNGGTEVFVEVLALAVAALAERPWELRFAALLSWQDQSVLGRGAVGFDLAELDWGATPAERAAAKAFVLRATELAARGHRWAELGYEPPFAREYLRRFREIVEAFEPPAAVPPGDALPAPAVACCVRHRVPSALPHWEGCVLCHRSGPV
ncbi:hypothetical protein ACH4C6_23960 [Streptomyces sp. NPDC017943]|uniref:hypothetical protein n=1 Tax=Streptomyces sp. NPDC017943 TaxID=3365019 RepID=UPI0037BD0DFA